MSSACAAQCVVDAGRIKILVMSKHIGKVKALSLSEQAAKELRVVLKTSAVKAMMWCDEND